MDIIRKFLIKLIYNEIILYNNDIYIYIMQIYRTKFTYF